MNDVETETAKYDFILDSMGFTEEPLEQRAVVLCKILRELNIPFKKYYTSPNHRHLRTQPYTDFSGMGMIVVAVCDENYAGYTKYLYAQKMAVISKLNNML